MKSQIDPIYVYVYLKQADISYPIPSMEIWGRKAHTVWLGDIINEKKKANSFISVSGKWQSLS